MLFFSYQSRGANIVRSVAELLLAGGHAVWLDDYHVLLPKTSIFQAEIDAGIRACAFGLLFTNEAYARSEYCLDEPRKLNRRLSADRILEVSLDGSDDVRRAAELSTKALRLVVAGMSAEEQMTAVIDFVARHTDLAKLRCRAMELPGAPKLHFQARADPICFDAPGFVLDGHNRHRLDGSDQASFRFHDGSIDLEFNVNFDRNLQASPRVRDPARDASGPVSFVAIDRLGRAVHAH